MIAAPFPELLPADPWCCPLGVVIPYWTIVFWQPTIDEMHKDSWLLCRCKNKAWYYIRYVFFPFTPAWWTERKKTWVVTNYAMLVRWSLPLSFCFLTRGLSPHQISDDRWSGAGFTPCSFDTRQSKSCTHGVKVAQFLLNWQFFPTFQPMGTQRYIGGFERVKATLLLKL